MARISRTTRTAQTGWRVFITPGWVITFLLVALAIGQGRTDREPQ